jgi:hypothetical protein
VHCVCCRLAAFDNGSEWVVGLFVFAQCLWAAFNKDLEGFEASCQLSVCGPHGQGA